jgi:hypothetical protein
MKTNYRMKSLKATIKIIKKLDLSKECSWPIARGSRRTPK